MAKKKSDGLSYEALRKKILAKEYAPIYGLQGEEPFYIDAICDLIESTALEEAQRDFNLTIYYGKDANWSDVVGACRRFPMFAERQVVIIKEAQAMKDIEKLQVYIENPLESTILVIAHKYKAFDGRKSLAKQIASKGILYTSDLIPDYNIATWIQSYLQSQKINAGGKVIDMLALYLGTDLQKIVNEIEKVRINEPALAELTPELIEKYIGISKEYNVFKLPDAIMLGDTEAAFRMVNYFVANPKIAPMVLVCGSMFSKFSQLYTYHFVANKSQGEIAAALKISPYFVKDFQNYARRFNLARTEQALHTIKLFNLKSVGMNSSATDGSLLKELCGTLCYL